MELATKWFYTMDALICWGRETDFVGLGELPVGDRSSEFMNEKVLNS